MCPSGRLGSRKGSQRSCHKAVLWRVGGPSPFQAHYYQMMPSFIPPTFFTFPKTYFQFKGTAFSEQSSLRHKLGCFLWVAGVPKDSCSAGQHARKARGQWEAPGVPL